MFEAGQTYTRRQVQDALGVPAGKRGGHWQNGYPQYDGQLFIFCNVGAAGRTGHDYPNAWDGDDLLWTGRTGSTVDQPMMQEISSDAIPIHVFWRGNNATAAFTYRGRAKVLAVEASSPPRFRFGFTAAAVEPVVAAPGPTLRNLLGPDGQLFAKSEYGPANGDWPALSFSNHKIVADFAQEFQRSRDYVLFVGTSDSSTENPSHRRRVLSAVTIEPNAPISTAQIVPEDEWQASVAERGEKWQWSLPVLQAYDFQPYLQARQVIPNTYAALGYMRNIGRCVRVHPDDLVGLLDQPLVPIDLTLRSAVKKIVNLNSSAPDVRKALSQLALNIQQRIELSGQERIGHHPLRKGPNLSDIIGALTAKWAEQQGRCLLCGEVIPLKPTNRLLQMSPDRIDSEAKTYDADNVHLTHLGCNLAKHSGTMEDWREFLALIRGQPTPRAADGELD